MASSSKRARVAESDSEDSDSPFEIAEEITGGLESGEESELDRLLENESELSSDDDFSLYLSASELEEEDDEGVPDLPAPLPDVNPPRQAAPTAASRPTGTAAFYGAAAARPLPRVPAGPRAPPVVPVLARSSETSSTHCSMSIGQIRF
ncbi:uncharacterized protein LOC141897342 [Acropora palmata]|uniref:uncharacterized protein LOC141897342 n=1 Tax=Acropora palmata TaxID=6131 RepID=UPI003DA01EEE